LLKFGLVFFWFCQKKANGKKKNGGCFLTPNPIECKKTRCKKMCNNIQNINVQTINKNWISQSKVKLTFRARKSWGTLKKGEGGGCTGVKEALIFEIKQD